MEPLYEILNFSAPTLNGLVLVFMRIGAITMLLPGFGEQSIPMRIRLVITLAFTTIVWPVVSPQVDLTQNALIFAMIAEAAVGLIIGISIRLMVMALQLAGSIAAQSTSISQIAGANATPDPLPAVGNLLVMAGLALILAGGLHIKAAMAMIHSFEVLPIGQLPIGSEVAEWGVARIASVFALAIGLASPFIVASFAYNIGLGAINRAMPSLMVAFVGAPAITAGAIIILMLAAPVILMFWSGQVDAVLINPLGTP